MRIRSSSSHASVSLAGAIKEALGAFCLLTLATGLVYPVVTTGIAQSTMSQRANGSLVVHQDKVVGSELIAQDMSKLPFFQSRPSAANYDGASSSASNLGPTNPALLKSVQERVAYWQKARGDREPVPTDLVTTSGSGLDPHISRDVALYQIPIVAKRTGLKQSDLTALVNELESSGLFGRHHYVNVLQLNLRVQQMIDSQHSN